MGNCVEPRPKKNAFSKYAHSSNLKPQKSLNKSRSDNSDIFESKVSTHKHASKYRVSPNYLKKSHLQNISQADEETTHKFRMKRIDSIRIDDQQTISKYQDEQRQSKPRHFHKSLKCQQESVKMSYIKSSPRQVSRFPQDCEIIERSARQYKADRTGYLFNNPRITTKLQDFNLDIHIEPPKFSKYAPMDEATFEEQNYFPNKPGQLICPQHRGYFKNN